jgi:hypothetical protein
LRKAEAGLPSKGNEMADKLEINRDESEFLRLLDNLPAVRSIGFADPLDFILSTES